MRFVVALSLVLAACSAQSTGGLGTPDAGTPLCTPGAQVACACPGGAQSVQVCTAGGTLGPCACGDAGTTPAGPGAYEACTAGQSCGGGTLCTAATFTASGAAASLCTTACSVSAVCPNFGTSPAFLPTCVVDGATGQGQCYDTCSTNLDCGAGTQCALIPGTANHICVPSAGGGPGPNLPPAYTACAPAGGACGSATTCTPSMFARAGATQGNLCTIACTSGNAAMCPGYVAGAAVQAVECVAPMGNPSAAQCMRLCDPANANRDCAPYFATCASVQMAAGPITVCVP